MDYTKLSALMLIAGGGFFLFSAFIGGNILFLGLGAVVVFLGLRKMKNS